MDLQQRFNAFLKSLRTGIARLVHSRRIQARLEVGSALALGAGLVLSVAAILGVLDSSESRISDFLYQPPAPSPQVVIVGIDDASLVEIGRWPWPRSTLASLVDVVASAQPRVIALHLLFSDPSSEDAALAQSLSRAPNVVQAIIGVEATRFPDAPNSFARFDVALLPPPSLRTPNTTLAHTMIVPDQDGVVRRVSVAIEASDRRYAAFGVAALALAQGRTPVLQLEHNQVALGDLRLPVDNQGRMRLNFTDPKARRVISAGDLLRGRSDLAWLRDRIVLIGVTSSATPERFTSPLSLEGQSAHAVEIQADTIETILDKHTLANQDRLTQIVMIFLVALLAGATLPHFRLLSAAGLTILYFLAYVGYAFQKFADGIVVQPLYASLALILTFATTMIYRYFSEERPRELIRRLFRRYVAPEAVDQVLAVFDGDALQLGGARRQVSVLHVELREFTALTQTLAPETAVDLLNQYVSLIVNTIFQHSGSVIKQMGNAIVAVWNLPLSQIGHARLAVRAAVEIRAQVAELRKKQPKELAMEVGLGVATGKVVAGRIRAASLSDYTLVGEVITIAERLAMRRDASLFIDMKTHELIGTEIPTLEVNPFYLRRQTDPVMVWKVYDPTETEGEGEDERVAAAENETVR